QASLVLILINPNSSSSSCSFTATTSFLELSISRLSVPSTEVSRNVQCEPINLMTAHTVFSASTQDRILTPTSIIFFPYVHMLLRALVIQPNPPFSPSDTWQPSPLPETVHPL